MWVSHAPPPKQHTVDFGRILQQDWYASTVSVGFRIRRLQGELEAAAAAASFSIGVMAWSPAYISLKC